MAVRPIDADALREKFADILDKTYMDVLWWMPLPAPPTKE